MRTIIAVLVLATTALANPPKKEKLSNEDLATYKMLLRDLGTAKIGEQVVAAQQRPIIDLAQSKIDIEKEKVKKSESALSQWIGNLTIHYQFSFNTDSIGTDGTILKPPKPLLRFEQYQFVPSPMDSITFGAGGEWKINPDAVKP